MSTAADRPGQGEDVRVNPGANHRGRADSADRGAVEGIDPDISVGGGPEPADDADRDEIEADIARTRRELGETVEALSDKLDPKKQAGEQVEHLKARAQEQMDHARESAQSTLTQARHVIADPENPVPALLAALAGAAVFAGVGLLLTRRR